MKLLQARLRHFEDLGLTITSNTSAVGGHHSGASRTEAAAVGTVDSFRELQDKIQAYLAVIAEAEKVIEAIKAEKFRKILTLRYICGWSFRSISDEIGYHDEKSVFRAHGYALMAAQKILDTAKPD